ncbi:MAG: membrane dipeptidase, partial [Clostridia bacterium]|nr:membrane dipeptidase [Clostridia bacterium]
MNIIDAHCDTLHEAVQRGLTLTDDALCVSLPKLRQYGGFIQFFAAWIDDAEMQPFLRANHLIDKFYRELEDNRDTMAQILSFEDFESAFLDGRVGAMLTVENGNCLEGTLSNLHRLYQLGVRALTLCWNGSNEIADGIGV